MPNDELSAELCEVGRFLDLFEKGDRLSDLQKGLGANFDAVEEPQLRARLRQMRDDVAAERVKAREELRKLATR
jgi:hypothetical protein